MTDYVFLEKHAAFFDTPMLEKEDVDLASAYNNA